MGRLDGKVAVIVGAGQTPGEMIGNGRATALRFAEEGATLLLVDRAESSAAETQAMVEQGGGTASVIAADITDEESCAEITSVCVERYGRLDVLHNNVGIGVGDSSTTRMHAEAWDRIFEVNVKGAMMTCKHALPVMREQGNGVITNISSIAAVCSTNLVAYKASKAALNAYTHSLAMGNAKYGIRANAIMPGLMHTPMAIETYVSRGADRDELVRTRDAAVPLGNKMGTAWDIANAALFLASDEASFITGVMLPVDGGQSARIG